MKAGVGRIHDEHRRTLISFDPLAGARHTDRECRTLGAGDELLLSVDDPSTLDLPRCGPEHCWIRPRAGRWLAHRETGPHATLSQWTQVPLLLLPRRDELKHPHVALVWSGAVERVRPERAVSGLLIDHRRAAHIESLTTELDRDLRGENPGLAGGVLELCAKTVIQPARLHGDDCLADKRPRAFSEPLDFRSRREVDHAAIPPSTSRDAPVMYEASSEARKRAGATTSSSLAKRARGVASRISARIRWTASISSVSSVST